MHTPETKNEFVKLRAQGWSFARISSQLRVSKPTLLAWNRQHLSQVRSPRALELKVLQEIPVPEEELLRCHTHLRAIEQELASRTLQKVPTDQLHRLASLLRDHITELSPVKEWTTQRSNSVNPSPGQSNLIQPNPGKKCTPLPETVKKR